MQNVQSRFSLKPCLAISFVLFSFVLFPKQSITDSLRKVLVNLTTQPPSYTKDTSTVSTLNNLSWELMDSKPDTAFTMSTRALELAQKIKWEWGIARSYHCLGVYNYIKGNYTKSLELNFKAMEIWERLFPPWGGSKGAATLGNIGLVYNEQSDYPKALEYYFKALKIAEELGNKRNIANNLGNIGMVYKEQSDYPRALEYYFKALKIAEEMGNKSSIANNLGNIGSVYNEQSDYPRALEYYFKALKIAEEMGNKSSIVNNLGNIGNVYSYQFDYPRALEYYFKALKIAEDMGNRRSIAINLGNIGSLYTKTGKFSEAEKNLKDAISISNEIKALFLIKELQQYFSQLYDTLSTLPQTPIEKRGEYARLAMEHYKKYVAAKDSISNDEQKKKQMRSEMNFEYEKKEALAKADFDKQIAITEMSKKIALAEGERRRQLLETEKQVSLAEANIKTAHAETRKSEEEKKRLLAESEKRKAILESDKKMAVAAEEKQQQQIITGSVALGLLLAAGFAFFVFRSLRVTQKQKRLIEMQKKEVDKKNLQIEDQKKMVEEKNKDITDSIHYASRIQRALLTSEAYIQKHMNSFEYFILFKPKDIVSGDFYWANYTANGKEGNFLLCCGDCTGHGVPGAFMSLLNISILNELAIEKKITRPDQVLNGAREEIIRALNPEGTNVEGKDGMDCTLCSFKIENGKTILEHAAANNAPLLVREGELTKLHTDTMPVGMHGGEKKDFTLQQTELKKGDVIYCFTDGYADQFGGPNGKKFKYKQLKELLQANHHRSMQDQKQILEREFENWKGHHEQVDDVCLIGIRV